MNRMKQLTLPVAAAAFLAGAGAVAAAPPAPGPGFGAHVASMAPEHPREHGGHFGACVSAMATVEECLHHE